MQESLLEEGKMLVDRSASEDVFARVPELASQTDYFACQIFTVLSLLPEATRVPSGDQATHVVQAV